MAKAWMHGLDEHDREIAIRATREVRIRAGLIEPTTDEERRWRDEGKVPPEQLDCVRFADA